MFAAVARWLERLPPDRLPSCEELNHLLGPEAKSGRDIPIRFVQAGRSLTEPYETSIGRTGQVPTRPGNWHDFFNALVWLSFPRTKGVINRRHCEEIARAGGNVAGIRGTARDVLTLFDEGGVIAMSNEPSLLDLLRGFQWKTLFWQRRAEVRKHMSFFVFGHAILEKALEPYKGVTAKALLLEVTPAFAAMPLELQVAQADCQAAQWFSAPLALSSTRNLAPLPVLGVPGWADNEAAEFYDDARVFRPGYATPESDL